LIAVLLVEAEKLQCLIPEDCRAMMALFSDAQDKLMNLWSSARYWTC
jgi:hypothetical protein